MRELSVQERGIVRALIRHGKDPAAPNGVSSSDRISWESMISDLTICGQCDCGLCVSPDFAYKGVAPDWQAISKRVVLEAGNRELLVLLFVDDDRPTGLEVISYEGQPVIDFPAPDDLTFR